MKKYLAVLAALLMGASCCSCGILYALYTVNQVREQEPEAILETTGDPGDTFIYLDLSEDELEAAHRKYVV